MFTDVSGQLVAFFFLFWVVKETIQTVKIEAKTPKKAGNYLPNYKVLLMITSRASSSFEIKSFSNCGYSISLTVVYLQY